MNPSVLPGPTVHTSPVGNVFPEREGDWKITCSGGGTSNGEPYISSRSSGKSSIPLAIGCHGAQTHELLLWRIVLPPTSFQMARPADDRLKRF